jgi:DNA-binding beta-propeller fold protein YncE
MERRDFLRYTAVTVGGLALGCGSSSDNGAVAFGGNAPNPTAPLQPTLGRTLIGGRFAFDEQGNRYEIDPSAATISRFSPSGTRVWQVGTKGIGERDLDTPVALAVDPTGVIWVLDRGLARLQLLDANGGFLRNVAVRGLLQDVVIGGSRVFVSDAHGRQIAVFDLEGNPLGRFGTTLNYPRGLALDGAGRLHIADTGNGEIDIYTPQGAPVGSYGSSGIFRHPLGLAIRRQDGLIAVVDAVERNIELFSSNLQPLGTLEVPLQPLDLIFGPDGQLYVGGLARQGA